MSDRPDLRSRARGSEQLSKAEVALRADTRSEILKMEQAFAAALPTGVEARQIIRDALSVMQATPKLYSVDRMSLLGSLMTCSQLALRPGVLGQAWVLPFRGKAQFVAGYHGLKDIAHRSQQIRDVVAEPVREDDEFDLSRGSRPFIHHKPDPRKSIADRGEIFGYYASVTTIHGGTYIDFMTEEELVIHRDRFALQREWNEQTRKFDGPVKGPWIDNPVPMRRKTVLKRALALAPRSLEMQAVNLVDESVRRDLRPLDLMAASRVGDHVVWNDGDAPAGGDQDAEVIDAVPVDDDPRHDPTQGGGFRG